MLDNNFYPTGMHNQNVAHFASIVRISLIDTKIDEIELNLLEKL